MSHTDKIKIVLVDDHNLIRDAVGGMLRQEDNFQIVGSLESGEQLISDLRNLNPDVVIMDIMLKGMTGIEATRWVKERSSKTKVILLSTEIKKDFVTRGIQAGIDGYL